MRAKDSEALPLVILYVEDMYWGETFFSYIKERWGPESRWVRSKQAAKGLLESGAIRPDFVIHDCSPLDRDDTDRDSEQAGSELYAYFVRKGIPVVIMSGRDEETILRNPTYRAAPPLRFIDKPVTCEKIDDAVGAYLSWKEESRR
jgi:hypothetical protein